MVKKIVSKCVENFKGRHCCHHWQQNYQIIELILSFHLNTWDLVIQFLYMQGIFILQIKKHKNSTLRIKCPYSQLFWYAFFSHFSASGRNPNAGKCGENADQNNFEQGHFSRSAMFLYLLVQPEAIPILNRYQQNRPKDFY